MADNSADGSDDSNDPLDKLGDDRHSTAAEEIRSIQEDDSEGESDGDDDGNTVEGQSGEVDADGGTATETSPESTPGPEIDEDDDDDAPAGDDEDESEAEADGEAESGGGGDDEDASTPEDGADEEGNEKPQYKSSSIYLADPELTKYRHTYFKRLELDRPELQECLQRELQWALMSVAMQDDLRDEVADRAIKYLKRRKNREAE